MLGSVSKPLPDNNVTKFPDKDLVMLTTVNIYLVLNRKEDAIRFYKKTLQIYPGSEEAKDRLKELEGK